MYDVVEIVQFYQPNAQCMRIVHTRSILIFCGIGLVVPGPRLANAHALTNYQPNTVYYSLVV